MENQSNYLVSIIIATFNRANFIATTLDSILNQTYTNWEVIIIDDGSKDNTSEVLETYLLDKRIKFYKRPYEVTKGCPGSRNFGRKKSLGEYIWFFDDDDIAHPLLLEFCVNELSNSNIDFCRFGRTIFFNENNIKFNFKTDYRTFRIDKTKLEEVIDGRLPFNSCQVIWKKDSLGHQFFDEGIIYADDWNFYSFLVASGLEGISINKKLLYARKHKGSATSKYRSKDPEIMRSVIQAHKNVIDICIRERITGDHMLQFFFRQALLFKNFEIVKYLIDGFSLSFYMKIKYQLGFFIHPILVPIFKLKKILKN